MTLNILLVFLVGWLSAVLGKPISISQRPVILLHGFGSACTEQWYVNLSAELNATCIETGAHSQSFQPYSRLAARGCEEFRTILKNEPERYRNGFYLFTASNGGIITRRLMLDCPEFHHLLRRVIMLGTPNLGTYLDSVPFKEQLRGLFHNKRLALRYALHKIKAGRQSEVDLIKNLDYKSDNNYIKVLAGEEAARGSAFYSRLELWTNVASDQDFYVPFQSSLFGANYLIEENKLTPFSESEAFRKRYLGLNFLYNEGRYMNCVVKGEHAEMDDIKEREGLYELLNDQCLFDPEIFSNRSDSELYKICLKMKMLHSKRVQNLRCDPTATQLYYHITAMKKLKNLTVVSYSKAKHFEVL